MTNPMTLNPQSLGFRMKEMMLAYPSLFPIRIHALHHLYCVLGNGYDWQGGILIERCDDPRRKIVEEMLLRGAPLEEIRAKVKAITDEQRRKTFDDLYERLKARGMTEEDLEGPIPVFRNVYPISEG